TTRACESRDAFQVESRPTSDTRQSARLRLAVRHHRQADRSLAGYRSPPLRRAGFFFSSPCRSPRRNVAARWGKGAIGTPTIVPCRAEEQSNSRRLRREAQASEERSAESGPEPAG